MRLPAVIFLSFLAILAFGCRKPLTPNIDRNLAPETWIVAAPQDTVTRFDELGRAIRPAPGTIASRFHMYWAGSDPDGAVVGFYYAVVETLPTPPPGFNRVPPLPGPKPQDYRFTARSDSTFIFNVSEFRDDRQHAFFIYAVDNQGKADPTPARVIFNSLDRYPPKPILEQATSTGPIYRMLNGQVVSRDTVIFITDSFDTVGKAPRDTVPVTGRLDFRWHGEPQLAGTYVTGYQYKLDEAQFVNVDSSVHSVSYNTGRPGDVLPPGIKIFTLRALDEAGGAKEVNRYFYVNFFPDTWFSGPDLALYPRQPDASSPFNERYVDVGRNWSTLPPMPGSLLSCDSLSKLPAERPERKTFFEIYKDRLYVHAEDDTVRLNSFVIIHGGGSDLDSPYNIKANPLDPDYPNTAACADTQVIRASGPNGSPVGLRMQVTTLADFATAASTPSQSVLFPVYDPASPFRAPRVGGYEVMRLSGRAYVVLRSEDGNGQQDKRILRPKEIVDRIEHNTFNATDLELRKKILTFYINKAPRLLTRSPGFFPPEPWPYTFPSRQLRLNLLADDDDPVDPSDPRSPGGPTSHKVLRWSVDVVGKNALNERVVFHATPTPVFSSQITIDLPNDIVSTSDTLRVQLCDCPTCELAPGQGRCVNYDIPITVPPPAVVTAPEAIEGPSRPGTSNAVRRSVSP